MVNDAVSVPENGSLQGRAYERSWTRPKTVHPCERKERAMNKTSVERVGLALGLSLTLLSRGSMGNRFPRLPGGDLAACRLLTVKEEK